MDIYNLISTTLFVNCICCVMTRSVNYYIIFKNRMYFKIGCIIDNSILIYKGIMYKHIT